MPNLLWLLPGLPLAGFLLLALVGARLPRRVVALIGVGSVGLSAALAAVIGLRFLAAPSGDQAWVRTLWTWMEIGRFAPAIALRLDALSLVMTLVVAFVGFLIHLYSARFMAADEGYSRFFAYMNLFVAAMLILVLADDLLLLYLGWEGVGLCSYLLIGFWYRDPANGRAAMKAFIVTRVGDAAMAVGLLLLAAHLGTLRIEELMTRAAAEWAPGSALAVAAAALLLAGAVGKSAQLPLQTWLPDAMAGPTPVSALIHAATMVTAGVYLIARTHALFALAPAVQWLVAVIGAVTLLLAACSALAQTDLKRVLAYSTISQVGYMFLALGVGAWSAAIFHLVTHAFFKALLFLGAGVLIMHFHEQRDLREMGGARKALPLVFWTFLIGALSLSSFPFVTAGFYSKDLILYEAWASDRGSPWLWAAGFVGAILTALYAFRMVFLVFSGEQKEGVPVRTGALIGMPLVVLAVGAACAGLLELPPTLGHRPAFSTLVHAVLPPAVLANGGPRLATTLFTLSAVASIGGLLLAYGLFGRPRPVLSAAARSPIVAAVGRLWLAGWGFDWLYDRLFVRPLLRLAGANRSDVLDLIYRGIAALTDLLHHALARTQTGNVRWYAAGITLGAIVLLALAVFRWA